MCKTLRQVPQGHMHLGCTLTWLDYNLVEGWQGNMTSTLITRNNMAKSRLLEPQKVDIFSSLTAYGHQ